jgi:glutaredoxin-like YruB-family protein
MSKAMTKQVVVYSQPNCPPCGWVKDFLDREGITYEAKDVTKDAAALEELAKLGSQSTPTVVVDGEVLIGFEEKKLRAALGI